MERSNPSLLRKISNFTKAVAKHAADGLEQTPDDIYLLRISVCKGTDDTPACNAFDATTTVCDDWRCGCSVNKKAHWQSEDCPRGLWPRTSKSKKQTEDVSSRTI
jgi:hypothetical protein